MNLEPDPAAAAYRWRFDRQAFQDLHERFTREDLWPVIERGEVPVQVIRGGRSRYVSDADAARLQAAGVPVDTLAGAGHHVHVEALDALVDCWRGAERAGLPSPLPSPLRGRGQTCSEDAGRDTAHRRDLFALAPAAGEGTGEGRRLRAATSRRPAAPVPCARTAGAPGRGCG